MSEQTNKSPKRTWTMWALSLLPIILLYELVNLFIGKNINIVPWYGWLALLVITSLYSIKKFMDIKDDYDDDLFKIQSVLYVYCKNKENNQITKLNIYEKIEAFFEDIRNPDRIHEDLEFSNYIYYTLNAKSDKQTDKNYFHKWDKEFSRLEGEDKFIAEITIRQIYKIYIKTVFKQFLLVESLRLLTTVLLVYSLFPRSI